jgi:hypothetical protein
MATAVLVVCLLAAVVATTALASPRARRRR